MLVIFDCDGVLIDSETIYVRGEMEYLAKAGAHFELESYIRAFLGCSDTDWLELTAKAIKEQTGQLPPPGFYEPFHDFIRERLDREMCLIPGVEETLALMDVERCVASNTSLPLLEWKMKRAGLFDTFSPHIFSADCVKRGKPAPDLFLHAAAAFGVEPDRCIVVEDSSHGVTAGKAANMAVIGFIGGGHCLSDHGEVLNRAGAELVIDDFRKLPAAISELKIRDPQRFRQKVSPKEALTT